MTQYDTIIIGGGINSLVAATIFGQAGKNVIILESRQKLGGMAATEEFIPGYKCNLIYDYLPWINIDLIEKLHLDQYGLEFLSIDPLRISLDKNGKHITFYENPEKTATSISRHSTKDAEKWTYVTQYIAKLTQFLEPIYNTTPPAISEFGLGDILAIKSMLKPLKNHGTRGLVDILRTAPMMMPELMDEWFESDLLRGSLSASGIIHITQGPYSAATVLNFLHQHIYSNGSIYSAQFVKGGTDMLTQVLGKSAHDSGVEIRLGSQVSSIICNNGVCTGVNTVDGKTYTGNKIISGLDPTQTCIKLIGANKLSPTFYRQLKNIKYRGSTARVHFALNKIPKITGVTTDQMGSVFSINPSIEYLERAYDDAKYGHFSENPYIEFSIPSITNPNFAPRGKHVLSTTIQYVPYSLNNDNLDFNYKEQITHNLIHILGRYIPGFSDMIENSTLMTPADFEASLGLSEGSFNHGEMTLDQFFFMRPTMSCSQYSTPIKNLFLCGPGTHPGGGLHGTNGLNASKEIINI